MQTLTRWFAPALLAAGLGLGAMTPAPAQAQDSLARVLVDVANVAFNGGTPYDRNGNYGPDDRLVTGRDAYGRTVYYRQVPYGQAAYGRGNYDPRNAYPTYGNGYDRNGGAPPYGNAYGYYRNGPGSRSHYNKHHRRRADSWNERRYDDEDDGDRDQEREGRGHRGHDRDDD